MKFYNLHSTLFILVPDVDYLVSPGASGSTFHSVYISTANAAAIKYQISASTFHSVYISTELFKQSTFHSVYISTGYNIYTIDECGNLHSTLFILVPQGAFTLDRKTGNLHSTLFILVLYQRFLTVCGNGLSTFHSVYISTIIPDAPSPFTSLSTFHSVYISTVIPSPTSANEFFNLHSTLFILVQMERI